MHFNAFQKHFNSISFGARPFPLAQPCAGEAAGVDHGRASQARSNNSLKQILSIYAVYSKTEDDMDTLAIISSSILIPSES